MKELEWSEVAIEVEVMDMLAIEVEGWGDEIEEVENGYINNKKSENTVRIVGKPKSFKKHFVDGTSVKCTGNGCIHCSRGIKATTQYTVEVIDRTNGEVKILSGGNMIFGKLKEYANDPEWGDPREYDVRIKGVGEGKQRKYTVTANPNKTPLTDEEKNKVEEYRKKKYDEWNI